MKLKNFLRLVFALLVTVVVSLPVSAGEIIGDGTNGFFVHEMSPNVGLFGMELTDSIPFYGEKSQKFWIHSLGNGSVKIRKNYTQPIPRNNYNECLIFDGIYDLTPPVSNVYIKASFYISGDGQNFFYVGAFEHGRGVIGLFWIQIIMPFQNGAPQSITATQIEFQVYFLGTPSSDSIRAKCGLDYWSFSFFSDPKITIEDFEGTPSGILNQNNGIPEKYSLSQNYPNPFNPTTKIVFDIPKVSQTKLIVYDMLGREIATLVNEKLNAGSYEVQWSASGGASNYPSGVYFYKLQTDNFTDVKKMILVK